MILKKFILELNKRFIFDTELEFIEFFIDFFQNNFGIKSVYIDNNKNSYSVDENEKVITYIKSSVCNDEYEHLTTTQKIDTLDIPSITQLANFTSIHKKLIDIDSHTMGVLLFEDISNKMEIDNFDEILLVIARELFLLDNSSRNKDILHRYQVLTELSNDMIVILEDYKISYANKITYSKFGTSYVEIINKDITNFIHPDDVHKILWGLKNNKDDVVLPENYIFRIKLEDQILHVSATAKKIRSQSRNALLVYMTDITEKTLFEEHKKLISKEKKQMETIKTGLEKFVTIGQISSGIIHEINQPLHSIRTIIDGIHFLDQSDNPLPYNELLSDIDKIYSRVNRISEIINSMRTLMNVNSSDTVSVIEINNEIRKIVNVKKPLLAKKKIKLKTKFYEHKNEIRISSIQFQQVLLNLIDNAVIALKKVHKNDKEIKISTSKIANTTVIEIVDNGSGIDECNADQIFTPFFSTYTDKSNSGLGLFIVKQILSCYNGTISFQNQETGGVKFIIEISD